LYHTEDVRKFLNQSSESQPPIPIWIVNRSKKEGPIISQWRWLADSSGLAFLESSDSGRQRLVIANLRRKMIEPLSSLTETVTAFDIRDRRHYVYTTVDSGGANKWQARRLAEHEAPAVVGTGRPLWQLLFPDNLRFTSLETQRHFRAALADDIFEVKADGAPIIPGGSFALSPDGTSVVTKMPLGDVPISWTTLYPPSFALAPYRIHAGSTPQRYVRINLKTGTVESLSNAPVSNDAGGWAWVYASPSWSEDGQAILLPGTFLRSKENTPSRPCVAAVVDVPSNTATCVDTLNGRTETGVEEGYHEIDDVYFARSDRHRVVVVSINRVNSSPKTTEYQLAVDGSWQEIGRDKRKPEIRKDSDLKISVKQGINQPPLLVAENEWTSRVILDPNPQLKNFALGEATVYGWKDKEGREWKGGLYKPPNYKPGKRYPLVIQTHGFTEVEFIPSGYYATAFAARALAARGMMVLQVGEHCPAWTSLEGSCAVSGYESAVKQLVAEGLVDPQNIGIVGFSRTCYYVMETLTTDSFHLRAASVTDGVMLDYFQYLLVDLSIEYDPMIGAKPFGVGLQQWLKRSPGFNLDKINTPLMVVGLGPVSLLTMWEPYAGLRYLHKPVDLIMLNTDEHVLTNPAVRLASQGGSVDWFRFWLQDYEDPDPSKAAQYARWRELKKMRDANDEKAKESTPYH